MEMMIATREDEMSAVLLRNLIKACREIYRVEAHYGGKCFGAKI